MHECPNCGQACACDIEDTWFEGVDDCIHCDGNNCDDNDNDDGGYEEWRLERQEDDEQEDHAEHTDR